MKEFYKKLFKLQGLTFTKNADNPFFKSSYLTLEKLLHELNPILKENNLLLFHYTENKEVVTKLVDLDNEQSLISAFPIQDNIEPQKIGSAITYAKRYNIGQLFNIITDKDDDGNIASTQNTPQKAPQAPVSSETDLVCSVCGTKGKISQAGKPYCPQLCWKQDPSCKMVSPTEYNKEKTEEEINFEADMPAEK